MLDALGVGTEIWSMPVEIPGAIPFDEDRTHSAYDPDAVHRYWRSLVEIHRVLTRFTYTSGLAAIVLLLLPMVPGVGKTVNGAKIWIGVGPFSFQPGEVAKVLLVVAFAGYLVLHRDALALAGRRLLFIDLPRGRDLGPILGIRWQQWRSVGHLIQILVDHGRLGDRPPVMHQRGNDAVRIDGEVIRRQLLHALQINDAAEPRDPLLLQAKPHLDAAECIPVVIQNEF